jgi:hypothetical protein
MHTPSFSASFPGLAGEQAISPLPAPFRCPGVLLKLANLLGGGRAARGSSGLCRSIAI